MVAASSCRTATDSIGNPFDPVRDVLRSKLPLEAAAIRVPFRLARRRNHGVTLPVRWRMRYPFPRSTPLGMLLAGLVLGSLSAAAAPSRPKSGASKAGDSAPVLMSRTGGGSSWADVKELTAAAEKGNPKAQAQLGEMLLRGDPQYGVAQDRTRALTLLEQAARKGESSAAFRIGMLLDDGDGVRQDCSRALAYFRAAAAGGAMEAYHNIGAAYASGRGVKRDYAEGLAWLILAKKRGSEAPAEPALRAHIQKLKRPELVGAAKKRAAEIERELTSKPAIQFLPPPARF